MKNENKPDQEFTKIEPHILTKRLVICSHCGAEMSSVDHMIDEPHIFTTEWYCPKCERGTEMKVGQGKLLTRKGKQYQPTVLALLFHGDLALVVNAGAVDGKTDGLSYFFDEHTCPTNYLSRIRMIIDLKKEDPDPHGVFEYLATAPIPPEIIEGHFDMMDEDILASFGGIKGIKEKIKRRLNNEDYET